MKEALIEKITTKLPAGDGDFKRRLAHTLSLKKKEQWMTQDQFIEVVEFVAGIVPEDVERQALGSWVRWSVDHASMNSPWRFSF